MRLWLSIASLSGTLAVILGAFGAHALRERLTEAQLVSWNTAVQYHLLHSVALLALVLFSEATRRSTTLPSALFAAGIVLFSGSIYGLVLGGPRLLGPVTPLGGLCFIAGWLSLLMLVRTAE